MRLVCANSGAQKFGQHYINLGNLHKAKTHLVTSNIQEDSRNHLRSKRHLRPTHENKINEILKKKRKALKNSIDKK